MTRYMIALLMAGVLVPAAAHANCARDVQDAKAKVQQIKDDKMRARAQDYLQRARRELDENDEFECQSAIGSIDKIVAQQPK